VDEDDQCEDEGALAPESDTADIDDYAAMARMLDLWAAKGLGGLLGERIRQQREEDGFSQERLALSLGITPGLLEGIERGEERVGVDLLGRIVDMLTFDVPMLFGDLPMTEAEFRTAGKLWSRQQEQETPSFEELDESGAIDPGYDLVEWDIVYGIPERRARMYQTVGFEVAAARRWEEDADADVLDQTLRALVAANSERSR